MTQPSLFSVQPARYPHGAGSKVEGPSREAAESINPHELWVRVLRCLRDHGPLTADECADLMCKSVLSVRPRFSELHALGQIEDSGERRKNASGKHATVWRVKE